MNLSDDQLKVAICEELIAINSNYDPPSFIPPTAINWIGDNLVFAIRDAERVAVESDDPVGADLFSAPCDCGAFILFSPTEVLRPTSGYTAHTWHHCFFIKSDGSGVPIPKAGRDYRVDGSGTSED